MELAVRCRIIVGTVHCEVHSLVNARVVKAGFLTLCCTPLGTVARPLAQVVETGGTSPPEVFPWSCRCVGRGGLNRLAEALWCAGQDPLPAG